MRVLAGLARVFNGDPKVVDLARVMRLPGTTNSKRDEHVVCTVIEHNDREYAFEDIEEWLTWQRELVGEPVDPFLKAIDELGIKVPLDVQQMLDGMVYGENVHDVQLRVSASLQAAGTGEDEIVERILKATRLAVGQEGARWDWKREETNIRDMLKTAEQKFAKPKPQAVAASGGNIVNMMQEVEKRKPKKSESSGDDLPAFVKAGQITVQTWRTPMISLNGELWRYECGIWKRFDLSDQAELEMGLQKALTYLKASPSITNKRNAMKWVLNHEDLFRKDIEWDAKPIIVARNGVLELETGEIRPHAEDDYATRRIECDLDLDATCPTWLEFLETALGEDVKATVQEWFGAALIRGKRRELTRAMIAKGQSNTGKTQISKVLRALLRNGASGTQVRHLEGDFGLESFVGATGWVADDAVGQNEKLDPETFKLLVTGENITVMRKYLPPLETSFDFPIFLTCNHLPKVKDDSSAVYNRCLIVPMEHVFNPDEAPAEATSSTVIREELAGVLNWALEGWRRLEERGRFDPPEAMLNRIKEFQSDNAPLLAWIDECVDVDQGYEVERRDLLASVAGFYSENYGDDVKMPAPKKVYDLLAERAGVDRKPRKSAGNRYQPMIRLKEEGLSFWEATVSRLNSKFLGSGATKDGVNHRHKAALF